MRSTPRPTAGLVKRGRKSSCCKSCEQILVGTRVGVLARQPLQDVQGLGVAVELSGPARVGQGRDHRPAHAQPQAERVVGRQRAEVDALRVRQSAQQLVLGRVAEVDVMVDLGAVPHADFQVLVAQWRRGIVVDEQIVEHPCAASRIQQQSAAVVVDQVVVEPQRGAGLRHQGRPAIVEQQAIADQRLAADAQSASATRNDAQSVDPRRAVQS